MYLLTFEAKLTMFVVDDKNMTGSSHNLSEDICLLLPTFVARIK
jgi:hypothetical protein